MPEHVALPQTEAEVADFLRRPQFAERLDMLNLALRTGPVTTQLAAEILGLPVGVLGGVLAEWTAERAADSIIRIDAADGIFLLLCRSPEAVGAAVQAILSDHPGASVSVIEPAEIVKVH
jgi:hypothetical protein